MEINDYMIILMFATFIGLLFTGIPIAYVLGGVAILSVSYTHLTLPTN